MKSHIPTEEQIQARAYEFFVERGCEHGHDVEDWLAAESELNRESEFVGAEALALEELPSTRHQLASAGRSK